MVMSSAGLETKNDCAGEDQQQFTRPTGRQEGKRSVRRHKRRWDDNIKVDFREMGSRGMNWIDLARDMDQWRTLLDLVMNVWVP
jgi:hypothetical protein